MKTPLPTHPEPHTYTWSKLEERAIREAMLAAYKEGFKDGISEYAWWKDGAQYVGTCGKTLERALKELKL